MTNPFSTYFDICYSKKKQSVLSSHNFSFLNGKDGKEYQRRKSNGCNTDSTYINSFYEQPKKLLFLPEKILFLQLI